MNPCQCQSGCSADRPCGPRTLRHLQRPGRAPRTPESKKPFASVSTGRAAGTGLHSEDTKPAGALGGAPYPEVLFANWGLWHPPPPHPFLRVRGRRSGEDATCLGSRESQWEPDGMSGSDQWDSRCFPKSHELHSLAFPPPLPGALSAGRSTQPWIASTAHFRMCQIHSQMPRSQDLATRHKDRKITVGSLTAGHHAHFLLPYNTGTGKCTNATCTAGRIVTTWPVRARKGVHPGGDVGNHRGGDTASHSMDLQGVIPSCGKGRQMLDKLGTQ